MECSTPECSGVDVAIRANTLPLCEVCWFKLWGISKTSYTSELFKSLLDENPDWQWGRPGVVYYGMLDNGLVKIGYSTISNLKYRLHHLPFEYNFSVVEILALEYGSFAKEQFRHVQWKKNRWWAPGEQFYLTTDLELHIKTLKDDMDEELEQLITSYNPDGKDTAIEGEIVMTLKPPITQDTSWFYRGSTNEVIRELKRMRNGGFADFGDCIKLWAKNSTAKGLVTARGTRLIDLGAIKTNG